MLKRKGKVGRPKGFVPSAESKAKTSKSLMGNKNPCISSFEEIKELLETAIYRAKNDMVYIFALDNITKEPKLDANGNPIIIKQYPKYDFIGEVLLSLDVYYSDVDSKIKNYDNEKGDLKRLYANLNKTMEINCYRNVKEGNIKEGIGTRNLASHHRWTERQDNTSNDKELNNNIVIYIPEEK